MLCDLPFSHAPEDGSMPLKDKESIKNCWKKHFWKQCSLPCPVYCAFLTRPVVTFALWNWLYALSLGTHLQTPEKQWVHQKPLGAAQPKAPELRFNSDWWNHQIQLTASRSRSTCQSTNLSGSPLGNKTDKELQSIWPSLHSSWGLQSWWGNYNQQAPHSFSESGAMRKFPLV